MTIERETGQPSLAVRPDVRERYRVAARAATVLLVTGQLQKAEGVIHIVANRFDDHFSLMAAVPLRSRDFH